MSSERPSISKGNTKYVEMSSIAPLTTTPPHYIFFSNPTCSPLPPPYDDATGRHQGQSLGRGDIAENGCGGCWVENEGGGDLMVTTEVEKRGKGRVQEGQEA